MNEQRNGRNTNDDRQPGRMHEQAMHDRRDDRGYGESERGFGQGQSGAMAGRHGDDRSLGRQGMNQGFSEDDRAGRGQATRGGDETGGGWYGGGGGWYGGAGGTDDRWTGRGGEDYARGQSGEQTGRGYDRESYGRGGYSGQEQSGGRSGFGGYGGEPYGRGPGASGDPSGGRGAPQYGGGYGPQGGYGAQPAGGYGGSSQQYGNDWRGGHPQSNGSGGEAQGSHRGKGPKNFTRSDERLREQVCEALENDHHIDASEIEVEVKQGEVILTGTVGDRNLKRMAEDCVVQLPGIVEVQNQLRVASGNGNNRQGGSGSNPSDTTRVSTNEPERSKHRA